MKINFNLSLKLALIVLLVSATVISLLTYVNIQAQTSFFESAYSEKATALAQALDASISNREELENRYESQNRIYKFVYSNPDIKNLSINLPDPESGELKVFASNDLSSINDSAGQYNDLSYTNKSIVTIPAHSGNSHTLTVITPIHLGGQVVGTYEMTISMNSAYASLDIRVKNLIIISMVFLILLIISFLYLLRIFVIKPITIFRNAANIIGKGNLDTKIKIKSKDEIMELAGAFNKMTDDLKKSREEIENYSKTLEAQVNDRTIELEKSKEELFYLNKELEKKVLERTAEVQHLLKQKDDFIGQLGHDLKNPLTPLVGLLPLLRDKEKDPSIKEQLDVIISNVNYMKDLVVKILQLARLNSPSIKFDMGDLDISKEIGDIISSQQFFFKENNFLVENNIKEDIHVKADKMRVEELIKNLFTNAVKYTLDEKGTIVIDAEKKNGFVTISIKDTGIGMTPEEINRIFDEFYKADESRHEMDSSGLGLSICKRIVERHGGRIWAESNGKGKGSTFRFTLKLSEDK